MKVTECVSSLYENLQLLAYSNKFIIQGSALFMHKHTVDCYLWLDEFQYKAKRFAKNNTELGFYSLESNWQQSLHGF